MDDLEAQSRRLFLGRWLTRRAATLLGDVLPKEYSEDDLAEAAGVLEDPTEGLPMPAISFEPPYPGTAQHEPAGAPARLVLTCHVNHKQAPLGVVFTVLIAGRAPEVSVAPRADA